MRFEGTSKTADPKNAWHISLIIGKFSWGVQVIIDGLRLVVELVGWIVNYHGLIWGLNRPSRVGLHKNDQHRGSIASRGWFDFTFGAENKPRKTDGWHLKMCQKEKEIIFRFHVGMKFHPWITWKPPSQFWISSYLHWLGCVWFLGLCLKAPSSNRIWICRVFCICMSHVSRIRLDSSTLIFKNQYVRHYVFVLVTLWTNSRTLDAGFLSGHCQVVFDLGRYRSRQLKFYFGFQGCTCNRNICLKGTRQVRFQTCFMNLTIYAIIRNHNPWEKLPGSPVSLWVFSCWVTGSTEQQGIDQSVQSSIFTNSLQSFLGWTVSSCNQLS